MLKHLPENALSTLLHIFNDIWATGVFPDSWRLATVILIPKPGKDHAEPTDYRPIALTSCLFKTLERMINKRLVWYLESNDLISPIQSGFRSERSTNDHLIRLETFIHDAFVNREHVVSVFFDLEKAYDTTWRSGILKDLHDLGLKGRLPLFIQSFLEDRTMQGSRGWSGGAMVLGNFPVPGRPTNLDWSRARAYCACSRCGWGLFGHFYSHLSFLSSFSLSLGDGPI